MTALSTVYQVLTEEGRDLARDMNAPFFETSAAYRRFVDDSFHALIRMIRKQEREKTEVGRTRTRRQGRRSV